MAKKKSKSAPKKNTETEPKFPYTTKPSSLRKFLQDIPKKPKPTKFTKDLVKSWGYRDANDYSIIRVLKSIGMLNASNEPTDIYTDFMSLSIGGAALAAPLRKTYEPIFAASHEPHKESNEVLQNLFNIHSGGGERTLDQQIQTFKSLCENANFDSDVP